MKGAGRTTVRWCRDERGSVTVLFCFVVLIAGILVTAVVDGGTNIQAANRAETASAAVIAVGPVPTGGPGDVRLATAAANSYLQQAGATGAVTVLGPGLIEVAVTVTDTTPMLGLPVSQTRTHTAQLQVGVTIGEPVS